MFFSVNPLIFILLPAVLLQYIAALFCLFKLVKLDLPKKKFFIWNFFILLAILIGFTTFLICYYCFRDKVFYDAGVKTAEIKDENGKDTADGEIKDTGIENDK